MNLLWFCIGLLVGIGIVVGGFALMLAGISIGQKKAQKDETTDDILQEVK